LHAVGETIDGFGFQTRPTAHVNRVGDSRPAIDDKVHSSLHFSGTTCANTTRFSYTTLAEDKNGSAEIGRQTQIWQGGIEARGERDAPPQEGHTQVWRERKDGKESQAGDCDRFVRGP
jgi:hypothetical protein